uniref:Uncharacterized protein n=1 Tax=Arundo donax TaxID=35708 RepID=A0A0A9CN53_ARUDO
MHLERTAQSCMAHQGQGVYDHIYYGQSVQRLTTHSGTVSILDKRWFRINNTNPSQDQMLDPTKAVDTDHHNF